MLKLQPSLLRRLAPVLMLLCGLLTQPAHADEAKIRQVLGERFPNLSIRHVQRTNQLGLYEVFTGDGLVYVDEKASVLLAGDLIDLQTRRNISQERLSRLQAVPVKDLPLDQAFKQVHGDGKRVLVTFEDPNCGYCKRLAKELAKIDNLTIYTFLLPVLGPSSMEKSAQIWCSTDPAKAWNDWMLNGKTPSSKRCDTKVLERNLALGEKLGIRGTPAMIFTSGERIPGFTSKDVIETKLGE